MNKHSLKHLLLFISCLFLTYSCVSEDDVLQTGKTDQEKKVFSTFSQPSNLQGKNISSTINYAKGFAILMQRYDSIHKSNITGLVNTTNTVEHKKNSRQNVILENNDFYIETRLHSQTILDKNGDIWVMYPKIKNKLVDGLLIANYTDNETNVFFSYVKKDSELYISNVKLFQEKFDKQINNSINKKSNEDDLCGYGDEVCELDDVIIIGGGGSSGGCVGCQTNPPVNPGGGCSQFVDCIAPPDNGGGGGPINNNPCPKNPLKNIDIASPGSSGKNGGRYGNTRTDKYGNKKFHDGLDLTASPGTNLYSMYNGYIIDSRNSFENGEYKSKSYGNYITIESTINGETVTLKFNHLNKNNSPIKIGTYVSAGQLIGQTGITGNAAAKGVVPHVHIQASKNGNKTNPESYIGAKFDSKGNTISNGCK